MAFPIETALEYLKKAYDGERLGHAYIVSSRSPGAQEELATRLITMVNGVCVDSLDSAKRAGATVIRPESKSRRIKIEQVRELERALYMGGGGDGRRKIAIVSEADRLMVQAENAFLKTLEEPPSETLVLLLTSHPELLLDTILSRCIRVPLSAGCPDRPEIGGDEHSLLSLLDTHFKKGERGIGAALAMRQAFTDILKQTKEQITKHFDGEYKEEIRHYKQKTEGDYLKKREDIYKALAESRYLERRTLLIGVLSAWFGDCLRQKFGVGWLEYPEFSSGTAALAEKAPEAALVKRVEAVEKLRQYFETNAQEALVLEVGFIKLFG